MKQNIEDISFNDFCNSSIRLDNLCNKLQLFGIKKDELEKISRRNDIHGVPGTKYNLISDILEGVFTLGISSGVSFFILNQFNFPMSIKIIGGLIGGAGLTANYYNPAEDCGEYYAINGGSDPSSNQYFMFQDLAKNYPIQLNHILQNNSLGQ